MVAQIFTDTAWRTLMIVGGLLVVVGIFAGVALKRKVIMSVAVTVGILLLVFLSVFWKNMASAEAARALDIYATDHGDR